SYAGGARRRGGTCLSSARPAHRFEIHLARIAQLRRARSAARSRSHTPHHPGAPMNVRLGEEQMLESSPEGEAARPPDPLWYKDAIIYQLHVKAFYDSNGDGIGDFRGLTEKLDYIKDLGVNTIWLLPFYPSPLRDDGYDISDYHGIHPDYGTR